MTREELQKRLEAELIGKELDLSTYFNRTADLVEKFIKKELTILGKEELNKFITGRCNDRYYIVVLYKNYPLLTIHCKTTREYKHEPYSSTYYVSVIKSLTVSDYFNGFDERVKGIEDTILAGEKQKQIKLAEQVEFFKVVKSHYPNLEGYSLKSKLKELYDNFYAVEEAYNKGGESRE